MRTMITSIKMTLMINVENYLPDFIIANSVRLYKVATIGVYMISTQKFMTKYMGWQK